MNENFKGAQLREKQNDKLRFELPPQPNQTLGDMFGFLEVTGRLLSRMQMCSFPYQVYFRLYWRMFPVFCVSGRHSPTEASGLSCESSRIVRSGQCRTATAM